MIVKSCIKYCLYAKNIILIYDSNAKMELRSANVFLKEDQLVSFTDFS